MWRAVQKRLRAFVRAGAARGVQLSIGYKSENLGVFCAGMADPDLKIPMRPNTLFDLSSLTKVIVVVWCLACARHQRKMESFDEAIGTRFPHFQSALREVSFRELLEHRSGLPAVFENTDQSSSERSDRIRQFLESIDQSYEPEKRGQELYSDVGFMLLGLILEEIYAKDLSQIFEDLYAKREDLSFSPQAFLPRWWMRFLPAETIASRYSLGEGQEKLTNQVQDPRAQWLGGISGHAGLFGTARAVDDWAREVYEIYHGKGLRVGDKSLRELVDLDLRSEGKRFIGGFDTADLSGNSQAGRKVTSFTIGHLAYTGCSLWMDMESGWRVVLLTQRHQSSVDPERIKSLRPLLHDWLYEEVFSKIRQL